MGNLSPIGEAEKTRMEEITKRSVETFVKEFALAIPVAVLTVCKAEANADAKKLPGLLLDQPGLQSEPLKMGRLIKSNPDPDSGSWQERFFCMYNAVDNFKIEYFDAQDSSDEKTKKGTIWTHSYRCEELNKDDRGLYFADGEFGFKMTPWWYSDRRRTWYFKLPPNKDRTEEQSKKELKEWRDAFETSCQGAKTPSECDATTAIAFAIALDKTRWAAGVWGWYGWFGSESERMCEFIYQILEREVLNEALRDVGPAFLRHRIISTVQSAVRNSVTAACKPAIATALAAAGEVVKKIKEFCQQGLAPIFDAENGLKTKIIDLVSDAATPTVQKLGAEKLQPIMSAMFGEIEKAFVASVSSFHVKMNKRIDNDFEADTFNDKVIKRAERYLDYWWDENIIEDSIRILYDMDNVTNPLYRYRDCLPPQFSFWDMYWMSRDRLKYLVRTGLLTLKNAKPQTKDEAKAALHQITGKYAHDAKIVMRQLIIHLLRNLVIWFVEELVTKPALKLIEPVTAMVEAMPDPLKTMFDLNAMLVDIIDGILINCIGALVDTTISKSYAAIDAGNPCPM